MSHRIIVMALFGRYGYVNGERIDPENFSGSDLKILGYASFRQSLGNPGMNWG